LSNLVLAAMLSSAFLSATVALAGEGVPAKEEEPPNDVIATCQQCHGPRGDSTSDTIPRLNGQHAEYIIERLNKFHDPTSEDPHAIRSMGRVIQKINNSSYASVAAYYARQVPTNADGTGALANEGRAIYMNGAAAQRVPACTACHGLHAEGNGRIPRLAGQHAVYLTNQMARFSLALRYSNVMHPNLYNATEQQIKALVAYLAGR
jgi:cytochrome c553